MDADKIIREYHEATYAYRARHVEEMAALESVTSDSLRSAKADLAVPEELRDRQLEAVIAFERLRNEREERWIAAHEDLAMLRKAGILQ